VGVGVEVEEGGDIAHEGVEKGVVVVWVGVVVEEWQW